MFVEQDWITRETIVLIAAKWFGKVSRSSANLYLKTKSRDTSTLQGIERAAFRMKFIDDEVRGHGMWVTRSVFFGRRRAYCSIFHAVFHV